MEVPVINRVGDLQLAIERLPMLISQVPEILSFWKWGAVILAVYAIVNSVLVRFKIELVRFGKRQSDLTKALLSYCSDEDYSSDDDVSVSSEDEDEYVHEKEDDYDEEEEEGVKDGVVASSSYEKVDDLSRFSWSDFANGKSVVKLWDGIGLGFDLSNSSGSIVSIHDLNHLRPVSKSPAPSVILSAEKDKATNFKLSLMDTRLGRQSMIAHWSSPELYSPTVAAIRSGGLQKVYLRDEAGEKMKVVDLRMGTDWPDDVVAGY